MDIVTLGAALNGSAEYVKSHFKGGANIQIVDNSDGTQTINASGEVSSEDTVARNAIADIKDGENLDSFADVETALATKVDKVSGKGLSTNDFTTAEKTKLDNLVEIKSIGTGLSLNSGTGELTAAGGGGGFTPTDAQLDAMNSGIDSAKVEQIETNQTNILNIQTAFENKNVKIIAGVIRNSGTGWRLIDDANHQPINIDSVSVDSANNIVINYGFTASKVLSLVVTPDDTFAKSYTCGASVGLSTATIALYTIPRTIGGFVYYNSSNSSWNVDSSDFTATYNSNTGQLTLSHESLSSYATKDIMNISVSGRDCNARLFSTASNAVNVKFYDWDGNVITTPSSDMKVCVARTINAVHANANNVINSGGNFWIYGILEVD